MLNFMETFSATPDPVVLLSSYNAAWEANIGDIDTDWYNYWLVIWDLTITTFEFVPGFPVDVVLWTIANQLSFGLWQLDDGYSCPKPCTMTSTFFALPV